MGGWGDIGGMGRHWEDGVTLGGWGDIGRMG